MQGMRAALQDVVRGRGDPPALIDPLLSHATLTPKVTTEKLPGCLRPCANTECNLFLIDRSRPGTAKWCSMATCGNRTKARAHARRQRTE